MGAFTKKQLTKIHNLMVSHRKERDARDAAAPEIVAIVITYDIPAPDGTFEILFMNNTEAKEFTTRLGSSERIDFADGVRLASLPDCCGGEFALKAARRFQKLNPFVQDLKLLPF